MASILHLQTAYEKGYNLQQDLRSTAQSRKQITEVCKVGTTLAFEAKRLKLSLLYYVTENGRFGGVDLNWRDCRRCLRLGCPCLEGFNH